MFIYVVVNIIASGNNVVNRRMQATGGNGTQADRVILIFLSIALGASLPYKELRVCCAVFWRFNMRINLYNVKPIPKVPL